MQSILEGRPRSDSYPIIFEVRLCYLLACSGDDDHLAHSGELVERHLVDPAGVRVCLSKSAMILERVLE